MSRSKRVGNNKRAFDKWHPLSTHTSIDQNQLGVDVAGGGAAKFEVFKFSTWIGSADADHDHFTLRIALALGVQGFYFGHLFVDLGQMGSRTLVAAVAVQSTCEPTIGFALQVRQRDQIRGFDRTIFLCKKGNAVGQQ